MTESYAFFKSQASVRKICSEAELQREVSKLETWKLVVFRGTSFYYSTFLAIVTLHVCIVTSTNPLEIEGIQRGLLANIAIYYC